jgi:demethylmenaquinone methyltransferase/2-methoxy-6-polyprenyl-1,4-benzoquinol methylase
MTIFDIFAPVYEYLHFGANHTAKQLNSVVTFEPNDNVLDVGGGVGRIAKLLRPKVKSITVADASAGMIKKCKENTELSCVLAKAENLPLPDNTFDKIIVVDAFHHFGDHDKVIEELKRVLKPGGLVILEEFNPATIFGKYIKYGEKILGMGSHFYKPLDLKKLFDTHGLQAKLFRETNHTYYLIAKK